MSWIGFYMRHSSNHCDLFTAYRPWTWSWFCVCSGTLSNTAWYSGAKAAQIYRRRLCCLDLQPHLMWPHTHWAALSYCQQQWLLPDSSGWKGFFDWRETEALARKTYNWGGPCSAPVVAWLSVTGVHLGRASRNWTGGDAPLSGHAGNDCTDGNSPKTQSRPGQSPLVGSFLLVCLPTVPQLHICQSCPNKKGNWWSRSNHATFKARLAIAVQGFACSMGTTSEMQFSQNKTNNGQSIVWIWMSCADNSS